MLTKKEKKHYKKLINKKFDEMGLSNGMEMRHTGKFALKTINAPWMAEGKMTYKKPVFVAKNTRKNLMKKLLDLSVVEVERFLSTEFEKKEDQDANVPTDQ